MISNAIKFTGQGQVTVELTGHDGSAETVEIRCVVRDTGPGLSETDQKVLFQPFSQADSSTTRKFGGTGLGLAICRKLIGLMGGQIGVESTPGKGSAFWFQVRLQRDSSVPQARPVVSGISAKAGSPAQLRRVLLVDDDPVNRMVATRQLQRSGCQVDAVPNGVEALAAWQKGAYDIIFMDCHMPEMDGFTAAREIRRSEQEKSVPPTVIIALTASAMMGDREACVQAGMDDYLAKPVTMEALRETLARIPPQALLRRGTDSGTTD